MSIDKSHPKFQTILDLIRHTLTFYLNDGQRFCIHHDDGTLWWDGIYQASVDAELGKVLDVILLS
ncbi:MAG: hypothetical protein QW222_01160 [Candidatus Bathyarchaeia archaeon]